MKTCKYAILALFVSAGSAVAGVIITRDVSFALAAGNFITTPLSFHTGGGDGVTFTYQPNVPGTDTASVDQNGIYADDTLGTLYFTFDVPVVGVHFNYTILGVLDTDVGCGVSSCSVLDTMGVGFSTGDSLYLPGTWANWNPTDPTSHTGDITGFFDYGGPITPAAPFLTAALYPYNKLSTTTAFQISGISYDTPAPEPVIFVLMGTALLGLGCARKLARRRS